MNLTTSVKWIYTKGLQYNLFMLEEHDYDDDDAVIKDPAVVLKHQKYKTWLYVVLLSVCLYVLFYVTLIKMESKTVVISNITPDLFRQLSFEHGETLSCPCKTITIPYRNFVFNNVTMHPVCSSIFVDEQWIERLYFANASLYGVFDFRTTAFSQFKIFSKFCSLSKEMISKIRTDLNNTDLISIELLSETQVQLELDGITAIQKNNAVSQMVSFLNYLRTTIQSDYLVTGLGTNWLIQLIKYNQWTSLTAGTAVKLFLNPVSFLTCSSRNLIIAATLSPLSNISISFSQRTRLQALPNSTIVKGFFTGCTPLEAFLQSTLECLYENECLQIWLKYFPELNQTNKNWINSILTSKHENISVINYINTLFIQNWSIEMNYPIYFDQCSPSLCTYTTQNRVALSYAITLFISLYGGLIIILRLVASYFIDIFFKFQKYSNHRNTNTFEPIQSLKHLNLFKNIHDRTEISIKQQRIITRVYLILLSGLICCLCLYTIFSKEIITITVSNPSMAMYESLENIYLTTVQCPCSNKTISHRIFMSFSPTFHQICSSGFVDEDWIILLKTSSNIANDNDWRNQAYKNFQLISDFCRLSNTTIKEAVDRFLSQVFIASTIMNKTDFDKQFNASINQFYRSTLYNFDLLKEVVYLTMQVDQLYSGSFKNTFLYNFDTRLVANVITNETNNITTQQVQFIQHEIIGVNPTLIECACNMNSYCQSQAVIYDNAYDYISNNDINLIYNISGWIQGCLAIDSLQLSTFQCLYIDSSCFPLLLSYVYGLNDATANLRSSSLRIEPLVYNSAMSHFPPNTSISIIMKEMMVEQWNPSLSYEYFYQACAPVYCSYSQIIHKENFLGVIVKLISMIGGIVVSLRILTPHLVKFILGFSKTFKKKTEQVHSVHTSRLKTMIKNLIKLIRTTLVEMNIFTSRDLGSDVDRITAKRYGQWATRLYFILFLSGLTILIFYTIIQPHTLTKNFNKPSFIYYNHLRKIYADELRCTCSKIASTYNQFAQIEPLFHPICKSEFVVKERQLDLVNGLNPNLTIYEQSDYRRFLSPHLQYLQGLCQLSQQAVNNSINEFLTSLLVTVDLLSNTNFENRLKILVEQSKSSAPILFTRLLLFTQSIFHGNAIISTYGTNYKYSALSNSPREVFAYTEPIIYDDNCSCGLSPNCTTQANILETKSTKMLIKGMKMGCTPSQSFLRSTLECFYDQSCLDLLQQYTNYSYSLTALSSKTTSASRFSQNTTIEELVQDLFVEQWSTQINYSLYYQQCLPSVCSYTTIGRFDIFYTISIILGIQGGLTIVLKWICPKLVRIGSKIYYHRKRRINPLRIEMLPPPCANPMNQHTTWNNDIALMNTRLPRSPSFLKIICVIAPLICILVGAILFSIYYSRQNSTTNITTINAFNTTIVTTVPASSNTSEPLLCQPAFDQLSINVSCQSIMLAPSVIADINSDNKVDIIFLCQDDRTIHILLGDDNSTFETAMTVIFDVDIWPYHIRVHDMNNDGQVDLILALYSEINILFGVGNGTFRTQDMQSVAIEGSPRHIVIVDLNHDELLDIIIIIDLEDYVYIYLADTNGTFLFQSTLFIEHWASSSSLFVVDFNNDTHLDIAVVNEHSRHIHVFYADTNGSYQPQKWFFTAFNVDQFGVVAGDFDSNNLADIAFLYNWEYMTCMLFRNNNDTFYANEQKFMGSSILLGSTVVGDLNGDKYLDIVIGTTTQYEIYGLLGNENGKFQIYNIYSNDLSNYEIWTDIADFNNDNCQDIISIN
ncbi:unnamed protein product, partial [Adineta ricciae]